MPDALKRRFDAPYLLLDEVALRLFVAPLLCFVPGERFGDAGAHVIALHGLVGHISDGALYEVAPDGSAAFAAFVVVIGGTVLRGPACPEHRRAAGRAVELSGQRKLTRAVDLTARPVTVIENAVYHVLLTLRPQSGHAAFHLVSGVLVNTRVLDAPEQLRDGVIGELRAALAALGAHGPHDVCHRASAKQHVLHAAHDRRLALVHHIAAINDVPPVEGATVRHATLSVLLDAVADALAVYGAFPFREDFEHAQLQHAARTARDLFPGVKYFNARLAQHDSCKRHFIAVAHNARHLVNHHIIK